MNYTKLSIMPDEILIPNYAYSIIAFGWGWPPELMRAAPPLFPYLLSILTYFFGGGLETLRLVPIFFGVLDVIVLFFLGKNIYNTKVGILSALFLALSSYHIIFSKIVMLETIIIFFILGSMYFFWKAYETNKLFYAIIAGIFIGLGIDTKYVAFLLYPSFILYLLWIKNKGFQLEWKSLLEKKFLVVILTSLLVFAPIVIDLYIYNVNPFYWQLVGRYHQQFAGYKTVSHFGVAKLVMHGLNNYVGVLMDANPDILNGFYIKSGSTATMSLPWLSLFELSVYLLLPITILYYFYFCLKKQSPESFILIAFLIFTAFVAIFPNRFQYYLLWSVPLFFIMLSNMSANFYNKIKFKSTSKVVLLARIFFLFAVGVFLSSYIYTGILSPSVNDSIKVGYEKNILIIKDVINPNDAIVTDEYEVTFYYLDKYKMRNFIYYIFEKYQENAVLTGVKVNLELLDIKKPKYIIVSTFYLSAYATSYDIMQIQNEYKLISDEDDVLLYERKGD